MAEKKAKKMRLDDYKKQLEFCKTYRRNIPSLDKRPLSETDEERVNNLVELQAELEQPTVRLLDGLVIGVEFVKRIPEFSSLCEEDQTIILKSASIEFMMIRYSGQGNPLPILRMTLDDCFPRVARCYLPDSDTTPFANQNTFNEETYEETYEEAGFNIEDIFKFCRKVKLREEIYMTIKFRTQVYKLGLSDPEAVLLTVISCFGERWNIKERAKVD